MASMGFVLILIIYVNIYVNLNIHICFVQIFVLWCLTDHRKLSLIIYNKNIYQKNVPFKRKTLLKVWIFHFEHTILHIIQQIPLQFA